MKGIVGLNKYVNAVSYNGQVIDNSHPTNNSRVLVSEVECVGSEQDIAQCPFVTEHSCDHSKDVAVSCYHDASRKYAGKSSVAYSSFIHLLTYLVAF